MTVVGFSENIVDMLTTPSSIQNPTALNTNALDASNYEIQGFSMSKTADKFKTNQHTYETVNLFHNSNLVSTSGWTQSDATLSSNIIEGPTIGTSGSLLVGDLSSGRLAQIVLFNGDNGQFDAPYFSGTWITFSVDMKMNKNNPPVQMSSTSAGDYISYSEVLLQGVGPGGEIVGQTPRFKVCWDGSGQAFLDDNINSLTFVGLASSGLCQGGIKSVGGGWYRVFITGYNGEGSFVGVSVYPALGSFADLANSLSATVSGEAGSIYIARPQLELGRVPTEYVETSSYHDVRDNTLAYSLLNETFPYGYATSAGMSGVPSFSGADASSSTPSYNYYVLSDSGGKSLSALYGLTDSNDKGVSAYAPIEGNLTPYVTPMDRELAPGARTPVEIALDIEVIQGQIPNILQLSGADTGVGSTQVTIPLSPYINLGISSIQLSSYNSKWSYTSGYDSSIGRHQAYLGGYAPNLSSTELSSWATINYISSLEFSAYSFWDGTVSATSSVISSVVVEGRANEGDVLDRFGYWELVSNGSANVATIGHSELQKTTSSDFSSTGEITYKITLDYSTLFPTDKNLLNIFGGVDYLGLWGLDLNKIKEDNPNAYSPYNTMRLDGTNTKSSDPARRYKLYNKIALTDNMTRSDGRATESGLFSYGASSKLNIYWKVKFI